MADLNEQVFRADEARKILESPVFVDAFEKIEAAINESWKKEDSTPEIRERAYLMHRLLQNLRQQFTTIVVNGKAAEKKLLELNKDSKIRRLING